MRINLTEAKNLLNKGKVVGIPTETVYGLAATLENEQAIQDIFQLKGRPSDNPLIIHVADFSHITPYLKRSVEDLEILAKRFWPGPLTIVLPIKPELIPSIARASLPTAAFRIPNHPLTLELLNETGPLVMPSANLSGRPSSTSPEHVEEDFGSKFPVLDGGACKNGVESTIIIYRNATWEIIRQGAIAAEQFETTLGMIPEIHQSSGAKPVCPGQMYRHYAPQAKLKLIKDFDADLEGVVVGFSDRTYPKNCKLISLGSLNQPHEIAANLYHVLRTLDSEKISEAYVDSNFPSSGLWATIAERLHKASGA